MRGRVPVLMVLCGAGLFLTAVVSTVGGYVVIFYDGFESGDATVWTSVPEICGNGIDDDRDGYIDCDDFDCEWDWICEYPESTCYDWFDNDGDGWTDCDDEDCYYDDACW